MRFRQIIAAALLFTLLSLSFHGSAVAANADKVPVETADIGIEPSVYRALISDRENIARDAVISVDGGAYRRADIRARGVSSRLVGQEMASKRIPFRIDFVSPAAGLPALDNSSAVFINSISVFQLYAEYIAMDLFEFMGIATPAHAFSFIRFNGVDFGLYLAVEDVNKEFLAKHFSDKFGSLYKSSFEVVPTEYVSSQWFNTVETVIDRGSGNIMNLLNALDSGVGYEAYLDMDEILRFFACTAATGAEDSILTLVNNFYLYENNGKFVLLPWDLNEAFSTFSTANHIDYRFDDGAPSRLFQLIMGSAEYRARYHAYLQQICDSFLAPEILRPYVEKLVGETIPYLSRDRSILLNTDHIEDGLLNGRGFMDSPLYSTLSQYYASLVSQLNGGPALPYIDDETDIGFAPATGQGTIKFFSGYSPMLDAGLPDKIQEAYDSWKQEAYGSGVSGVYGDTIIAACVFAAGGAVLAAAVSAPAVRDRLKTRRHKRDAARGRC